ncbi:hypothetical protein PV04_10588 [Phialophora macrospora]|uniref:Uncharacterized protein n=1 Tax=Phialophora macrospora TaxID=1851006 RepID=A0A0D2F634_9EURO|nr:hypothetical protein PV04_10588 [Phialophora macrospora]
MQRYTRPIRKKVCKELGIYLSRQFRCQNTLVQLVSFPPSSISNHVSGAQRNVLKPTSAPVYSYDVAMAPSPLRSKTVGHTSYHLGVRTILVVCCSSVLLVLFIVKRRRRLASLPHIERRTPSPTMEEKNPEGVLFGSGDPIDSVDRKLLTEILNPLLDVGPRKSSLMTSGYLAAKAKLEKAEESTSVLETHSQIQVLTIKPQDIQHHSIVEHQKLQWSRRSSPGPQHQVNTSATVAHHDRMENLSLTSSLHAESKHDETQYFYDDYNPVIKWRRRTLIFEKMP